MNQKSCFAHDEAYSHRKDLTKRTASNKILKDKAYEIGRNCDTIDIKEYQQVWSISF